ncbi:MAG: hypothetical protein PHU12_04645 [Candidatus Aenigmarchaeota archaeon]|nr:hypothetical protein [Candidatus Aenigmarchaeota archaeon]
MKGQFFIISTVIMISALMLIMNYLYDYGKIDLTNIEQMQELNYISDIKNSLRSTVRTACLTDQDPIHLDRSLNATESFLKDKLLARGIILDVRHRAISCTPTVTADIRFTIKSNDFYIENNLSV